jgi:hypothetical protein
MFKTDKAKERALEMHPIALMILFTMQVYCIENNLEFLVTDTVSTLDEDKELGRMSSTHRTGRAFDLRNKSWSLFEIKKFEKFFNDKFYDYAAVDRHGNSKLVVSVPHGSGPHFHVQIHSSYSLDIKLDD